MNGRRALYFVIAALVLASLVVAASALLARRLRAPAAQRPPEPAEVPVTSIAMPLDSAGNGFQVVNNKRLIYRLAPHPAQPGAPHELNLIVIDTRTGAVLPVTPTLEITREDAGAAGDVLSFDFPRNATGGYAARDVFFPETGIWRMRVRTELFEDETYSTVIVVKVR
jgi:hypothetical protein